MLKIKHFSLNRLNFKRIPKLKNITDKIKNFPNFQDSSRWLVFIAFDGWFGLGIKSDD